MRFARFSVNTKRAVARGIANALRFASLKELSPEEISTVRNSGLDAFRYMMITVSKSIPNEGSRINPVKCICDCEGSAWHDDTVTCPVHSPLDWQQSDVNTALAELRQANLTMHSIRRTAAVIIRVFCNEKLGREPNSYEVKRTQQLFGWKGKSGESLFFHYARDYKKYKLCELPLVWTGLMRIIMGVDPDPVE